MCEHCGYNGPVLETHVLYAVLQDEGSHAWQLLEGSTLLELSLFWDQVDALLDLISQVRRRKRPTAGR